MKIKKLTMALLAAGAVSTTGAFADEHLAYEEGDPPNLTIEQELMIVVYEAMLSAGGAMVVATSCETLDDKSPIPFTAQVFPELDKALMEVGSDTSNKIYFTAEYKPELNPAIVDRGNMYYLAQGIVQQFEPVFIATPNSTDGVFYQDGQILRNFNNLGALGYPPFYPVFSENSAIFLTSAHMNITPNLQVLGSIYDEHVIKDFYKLQELEGKCDGAVGGTNHPNCTPEAAFFDWGLEVITKFDYPEYKFRQDSEHIPWDGANGWWWIRKRLIADGANTPFGPAPDCWITAEGLYTGTADGQGSAVFTGELTFEQQEP